MVVWVGGLDLWELLMKGIVTWWYPDSNPKPPGPTDLPLDDIKQIQVQEQLWLITPHEGLICHGVPYMGVGWLAIKPVTSFVA